MKKVITFGTFDLFHIGHLHILRRAAKLGDHLTVGISSDKFSYSKKKRYPIFNENDRSMILQSLKWVDETFLEESMDLKREYILQHKADILVMGDDWKGKFDYLNDICQVVYLPRTTNISTTEILETIKDL
jgi:glycerol-3-phosphate cytidylyltransferase